MRRRHSSFVLAVAVAAMVLGPGGLAGAAQQGLAQTGDTKIAQRAPVICAPGSTQPYAYYDPIAGQWACSSTPRAALTKVVSNIADHTATAVLTVTVPNVSTAAILHVRLFGSIGESGTQKLFECSAAIEGNIAIVRTTGAAAVATASTAAQTANSCVSGATTLTFAYAVSSISGGTTGTDTFTVTVTLSQGDPSVPARHQTIVIAALQPNINSTSYISIQ